MRTWINTQLEILKQKVIKLGKILLSLLVVWATVRFDAFWITIPVLVAYQIMILPKRLETIKKKFLDREYKEFQEALAAANKDSKVEFKNRFGYKYSEYKG